MTEQSNEQIINKIEKEQEDLNINLQKLNSFICNSDDFKKLDLTLKSLLVNQYKVVDDYYELLELRKQYLNGNLDSFIVEDLEDSYDGLYKSVFGKGEVK